MATYFVKVFAADRAALVELQRQDLDLFRATARAPAGMPLEVGGLLSTADIERLVRAGYRVLVEEDAAIRSRAPVLATEFEPARLGEAAPALATGYLTVSGVEAALDHLRQTYPELCELLPLPEPTWEGRTCRAIRIRAGGGGARPGVLFLGGLHARELVNPDLLLSWSLRLCDAYTRGVALAFGGATFAAAQVRLLLEAVDLYVFPLVNPDGRAFVQAPGGDPMWRKNRNPNGGNPSRGVDLNRNFDFLWSSGIGTSTSPGSPTYRGAAAFSEPETRNVRSLLDAHPGIGHLVDVHSYSEVVLVPWGEDDTQTTDPSRSFTNPAFDGKRGVVGDAVYAEYMPAPDSRWYQRTGARVRDAIAAVRSRKYELIPSVLLYPTSGTSGDYAYGRRFADAAKRKVMTLDLETGREFQPPYAEALNVMAEVSAGLTEFALAAVCPVDHVAHGTRLERRLDDMRRFRDDELAGTAAGRRYVQLLEDHGAELAVLAVADRRLRAEVTALLERVVALAIPEGGRPAPVGGDLLREVDALVRRIASAASPALRIALASVRKDLPAFRDVTVAEGLRKASRGRTAARPTLRPDRRSARGTPRS